jgi:hypothetical protein
MVKLNARETYFSILNCKHFAEGDAFCDDGGPATYSAHIKNIVRRCVLEMLPGVAEKNNFV